MEEEVRAEVRASGVRGRHSTRDGRRARRHAALCVRERARGCAAAVEVHVAARRRRMAAGRRCMVRVWLTISLLRRQHDVRRESRTESKAARASKTVTL
jgi:hypothetical protein